MLIFLILYPSFFCFSYYYYYSLYFLFSLLLLIELLQEFLNQVHLNSFFLTLRNQNLSKRLPLLSFFWIMVWIKFYFYYQKKSFLIKHHHHHRHFLLFILKPFSKRFDLMEPAFATVNLNPLKKPQL